MSMTAAASPVVILYRYIDTIKTPPRNPDFAEFRAPVAAREVALPRAKTVGHGGWEGIYLSRGGYGSRGTHGFPLPARRHAVLTRREHRLALGGAGSTIT